MHACIQTYIHTVQTFNSCTIRPDICQCIVVLEHPWITCKDATKHINDPRIACKSEQRSIVRSYMHSSPKKWVAIGRAVLYYVWTADAFSAGIQCRQSTHTYKHTYIHTYTP